MSGEGKEHDWIKRTLHVVALVSALGAWTAATYGFVIRVHNVGAVPEQNARAIESLRVLADSLSDRTLRLELWTCDVNNISNRMCKWWLRQRMPLDEIRNEGRD